MQGTLCGRLRLSDSDARDGAVWARFPSQTTAAGNRASSIA